MHPFCWPNGRRTETNLTATPTPRNNMKKILLKTGCLIFLLATFGLPNARVQGQTNTLPSSFAVPAGTADTTKKGFLVRTWQSAGQPGTLAWTEEQLAGQHGANTADT